MNWTTVRTCERQLITGSIRTAWKRKTELLGPLAEDLGYVRYGRFPERIIIECEKSNGCLRESSVEHRLGYIQNPSTICQFGCSNIPTAEVARDSNLAELELRIVRRKYQRPSYRRGTFGLADKILHLVPKRMVNPWIHPPNDHDGYIIGWKMGLLVRLLCHNFEILGGLDWDG